MWKIYDLSGYGIGVVSSVDRLQTSIINDDMKLQFGNVCYIDSSREEKFMGSMYDPFMHKHKAFAHEQEFRAICSSGNLFQVIQKIHDDVGRKYGANMDHWMTLPTTPDEEARHVEVDLSLDIDAPTPRGVKFDVNIDTLIDYVVVSPNCQEWMLHRVRDYCQEKIGKCAKMSELRESAFFLVSCFPL